MRILTLVNHMASGGAEGAIVRLAEGLRGRGHEVETWFLHLREPTYMGREGVRVLLPHRPRGLADYGWIFRMLMKRVPAYRPDAVVSFLPCANVLGQAAAWAGGVPVRVASQRAVAWSYGRIMRRLDRVMGSMGGYTANVAVSDAVADSFARHPRGYRRRMRTVANGIAPRPSTLGRDEARAAFGLPAGPVLAMTLGRLEPGKNHAVLLRALAGIPALHLAIAGDGELLGQMRRLAGELGVGDRLHLLGGVEHERVPDLLRAADLFAFPSLFEGMSNAVLEALHAGLPIIASAIPAMAELLAPGDRPPIGRLAPPDDREAWAGELRRLAEDAELRDQLGRRSRDRAADFSLERMIDGFERCILERLNGKLIRMEVRP